MRKTIYLTLFFISLLFGNAGFAQISGTVFRDFNNNGTRQNTSGTFVEPGVKGIIINAYNASEVLIASYTSDEAGAYSIPSGSSTYNGTIGSNTGSVGSTVPVRLEFIVTSSGSCMSNSSFDYSSYSGTNYGTNVRFVSGGTTNVNFAVNNPADYVFDASPFSNTFLFLADHFSGNPLVNGTAKSEVAFWKFPYNRNGATPPSSTSEKLATAEQIGTVYGVAYSKQAKRVFTSAYMKRHSGFGPANGTFNNAPGAIYIIDPSKNSTTGAASYFISLDALGYPTHNSTGTPSYGGSSYSVSSSGSGFSQVQTVSYPSMAASAVIGSNSARGLAADITNPSNDPAAYGQVGKVSLGDIEISDDGKYLFVANLYDRKIYQLELNSASNPTSASFVASYALPNPPARSASGLPGASTTYSSETNDFYNGNKGYQRPFAIKYYRGKVLVGALTTAENGGTSTTDNNSGNCEYTDMWSYIWELTPSSGFSSTPLLQFPMNYFRDINEDNIDETWKPWNLTTPRRNIVGTNFQGSSGANGGEYTYYPTPMFTDIEVDVEGSFILGFRDRFGDQAGNRNYLLTGTSQFIIPITIGDMLRAYKNPSTCSYELEVNGKEGLNSTKSATSGKGNKEGPGMASSNATAANITGGNAAWTNLSSFTAEDGTAATTAGLTSGQTTQNLQITNFGLNINTNFAGGATTTILGITARVVKKSSDAGSLTDNVVRLIKGGTIVGSNYSAAGSWPTTFTGTNYGTGTTDLWGTSWTVAEVNASNFGINIKASRTANTPVPSVDYVEITVYYRVSVTVDGVTTTTDYSVNSSSANAGEFYYQDGIDVFDGNTSVGTRWHSNLGMGALALLPGSEHVTATHAEAISLNSGGISWMHNNTGANTRDYQIQNNTSLGGDAKTGGIGDLELLGEIPPIEIGNRVWADANADGIQTAGESGISGVLLELLVDFNKDGIPDTLKTAGTPSAANSEKFPGTVTGNTGSGTEAWTSPDNIKADDGIVATISGNLADNEITEDLIASNYGFAIPSNATITGIEVIIDRRATGTDDVQDESLRLIKGGSVQGNDKAATSTGWPATLTAVTYGSSSDLWGLTWTPTDINASNFGLAFSAQERGTGTSKVPEVDYIKIKVYYTIPVINKTAIAGTTTTNSNGEYYFNAANVTDGDTTFGAQAGLQPNKNYIVRLATSGTGNDWDPTLNGGTGGARSGSNLAGFQLTLSNKSGNGASDWSDNDATLINSIPQIAFTTGDIGDNNHTYDFGFDQLSAIGDKVWRDDDKDGTQDAGEPGVAGITVTLYQNGNDQTAGTTDDIVVGSTVTDAYGNYLFDNLTPTNQASSTTIGQTSYNVGFTLPANYQYTVSSSPGDNGNNTNSDANLYTGRTGGYNLAGGEYDATADAGIIFNQTGRASVGDYVWYDTNSDDDQDAGEPGVSGVTVTLYNSAGTSIIATTITDANGYYLFTDVTPSTYKIGFSLPPGTVFTGNSGALSTANNSDAITTAGANFGKTSTFTLNNGDHLRYVDAGIETQSTTKAALGDYVWYDNNRDGIQDQDEPGIGGVTVSLKNSGGTVIETTTTDIYGYYIFNNLTPGSYSVQFTAPSGMQITAKNQGSAGNKDSDADPSNGNTVQYTLIGGEKNMTVDCGLYGTGASNTVGALGDYVWYDLDKDGVQDNTESGVAGITVTLYNSGGSAIATTSTDNTGYYLFTNLTPANYSVGFSNISLGYQLTAQDQGGDDTKDSDANSGTGKTAQVTVTGGTTNTTLDAGIFKGAAAGLGSLGNRVWYDMPATAGGTNGNGIQDAGELGVAGVIVELLDGNGNSIDPDAGGSLTKTTTTTNALGEYMFTGLNAGSYTVEFSNLPTGFTLTTQNAGSDDEVDSDGGALSGGKSRTGVYNLAQGEDNLTVDLGLKQPANTNSLGNYVWFDTDADGVQDGSESGVPGAMVTLYYGSGDKAGCGTDNVATNFDNASDNDGTLNFSADWVLTASTLNTNTMRVTGNSGSAHRLINRPVYGVDNASISFTLAPTGISTSGETFIVEYTKDGGTNWIVLDTYNGSSANTGSKTFSSSGVPDLVNINGIRFREGTYASGDYVSVSNLNISFSENCAPVTTTTNINGEYLFAGLTDGTYSVGFSNLPSGFNFTTKSVSNDATGSDANTLGLTPTVTLGSGNRNDLSLDAGLVSTRAALGNYVWHDLNKDGDQDSNEPPIAGVTVTLYKGSNTIATAITNEDGLYLFPNLDAGNYEVGFTTVPDMVFTVKDATTESAGTDSDVDPATGKTASITLNPGEVNLKIDAGLYVEIPARLGNYVWSDRDKDGVQDANENGVAGVLVVLYNSSNVAIGSAVTDGNGYYEITNIPTGTGYYLIFTANLPGFDVTGTPGTNPAWTSQNVGTNATNSLDSGTESDTDSDVTVSGGNAGKTSTFSIEPGDNFPNMDAGIINAQIFSPLPVTWLKFKATLVNGEQDVHLDWSTATEINNSHFEVERSFDGRTFTKIAIVQSKGVSGYSSVILNYASLDKGVNVYGYNTLFYRIKQVDYDGKFDYTPIEIVYLKELNHVSVFPNPATEEINIHFNSELFRDKVTISITDLSGRTVYENIYYPSQISINKSTVNVMDLEPGYYSLSLSDGITTKIFKFLKN
jgi:protocatechuate 3,4-dioxygenase beta subunit